MSKHIFFVVLALAVTANSNALPPSTVDETSEMSVANMDTTHGESKRLLRVSDKMTDILGEERAGKAPSKVMLFGSEISSTSEAERQRELELAAKELKLKQPFEADAGVAGAAGGGTSSTISKLIDRRGLNRAEVAKREQLLKQYIGSSDRFGERIFNMAVGSVYFEFEASLLERGGRMKDLKDERKLLRTVTEYGEHFQSTRVDFGKVFTLALAMYRHERLKPDISVIVDMAFGSVFLATRMT